MLQNVNDRTHQNASSSRNRRASVIKEVSQNEHEGVSTRVIANYNHMHALSIQYYEVVQVFRVEVRLSKAEKVVFIPFAMPKFEDEKIVRRFQLVLQRAALDYQIYEALSSMDVIELTPERSSIFTVFGRPLNSLYKEALLTRSSLTAGTLRFSPPKAVIDATRSVVTAETAEAGDATGAEGTSTNTATPATSPAVSAERLARDSLALSGAFKFQAALPIISQANTYLWNKQKLSSNASLLKYPCFATLVMLCSFRPTASLRELRSLVRTCL